jgi:hypothetical protein
MQMRNQEMDCAVVHAEALFSFELSISIIASLPLHSVIMSDVPQHSMNSSLKQQHGCQHPDLCDLTT